jgi:hypothetical protein
MKKKATSPGGSKGRRAQQVEQRKERRFEPVRSQVALLTMAGTGIGGLALGMGVYAQWLAVHRLAYAPWIVAGGAVVLAAVILWGQLAGAAVRVGDAGIAVERGDAAPIRVAWYEITSISIKNGQAVVESKESTITLRLDEHPSAIAWLVREAEARIPGKMKLEDAQRASLPKTSDADGVVVAVEATQVTGRRCRASDKVITFERDARLCAKCGEIYHVEALPERCLTCDAPMSDGGK